MSGGMRPPAGRYPNPGGKSGMGHGGGEVARNHIPDGAFQSHFGRGHEFHLNHSVFVSSTPLIQIGGIGFRCDHAFPVGWVETDPVYVDYVGGSYFLCNRLRPGLRVAVDVAQCDACAAAAAQAPCDTCTQAAAEPDPCDSCSDTPTVTTGMTIAETVAILGTPKDIVNLGVRRIYLYDNVKVSFFAGRVSDVQ
jgi:hypothetical protein